MEVEARILFIRGDTIHLELISLKTPYALIFKIANLNYRT